MLRTTELLMLNSVKNPAKSGSGSGQNSLSGRTLLYCMLNSNQIEVLNSIQFMIPKREDFWL